MEHAAEVAFSNDHTFNRAFDRSRNKPGDSAPTQNHTGGTRSTSHLFSAFIH